MTPCMTTPPWFLKLQTHVRLATLLIFQIADIVDADNVFPGIVTPSKAASILRRSEKTHSESYVLARIDLILKTAVNPRHLPVGRRFATLRCADLALRRNAGHLQIAAGHHRVEAAKKCGLKVADVFVGEFDDN